MYVVPRIMVHTEWFSDDLLEVMKNYMASGSDSALIGESDEE